MQEMFSNANTIAAGDLNAHKVLWDRTQRARTENPSHKHSNLRFLPSTHYASMLDLIITSDSNDVCINKPITLTSPLSDHLPVLFSVESMLIDRQEQATSTKTKVDWDKYKEMATKTLRRLIRKEIQTMDDINESSSTHLVKSYRTQVLPRRVVALVKEKRRLQRSYLATRSTETFNQHRSSDTVLWRKISSIENANTQKSLQCPLLEFQDQLVTTPNEVTNIFREQLKKTFQPTNESEFDEPFKTTVESSTRQMFKYPPNGHQMFQPATAQEIMTILKDIRGLDAPGADKIANKALKCLAEEFHHIMVNVVNGYFIIIK
ncbi:hypothetical protein BpHYR1_033812 [Brachionus plicatilis]|uniref:Endonuclease/exonuclease/phosphatase domain-containing protein n=1 Tax=Brachionus plicatilis TaxID=10195 RepID=A0A3M7PH97_BRAPC|nr:hypothetical protein BpHYR1_033812 [Brachionus plicatilis]